MKKIKLTLLETMLLIITIGLFFLTLFQILAYFSLGDVKKPLMNEAYWMIPSQTIIKEIIVFSCLTFVFVALFRFFYKKNRN